MSSSCLNISTRGTREDIHQLRGLFIAKQAARNLNLIYPLNEFYEQSGEPLPFVAQVAGMDLPQPYRSLLVHQSDMTGMLEGTYHQSIRVRVLKSSLAGNVYSRQVVLVLAGDATPVEFGAIKVHLEHLPPQARQQLLEGKQPFGSILHAQSIAHVSRPEYYIQVMADALIAHALQMPEPCLLYGRRNTLLNTSQLPLAEVVEILPPSKRPIRRGEAS